MTFVSAFGLSAGVNVIANSSQYYRGDEANLLPPIPGYVVVNARLAYQIAGAVSVFVLVDNVFDARYSTFGVLGDATDVFPTYDDPRFLGPGAPRAAWVGVDLHLLTGAPTTVRKRATLSAAEEHDDTCKSASQSLVSVTSGCPWRSPSRASSPAPSGSTSTRRRSTSCGGAIDRNQEVPEAELKALLAHDHERHRRPRGRDVLRRRRADARRPQQRARSDARRARLGDRRQGPRARAPSSSSSRRSTRASPRRSAAPSSPRSRASRRARTSRSATRPSASTPATRSTRSSASSRSSRARTPRRSSASRPPTAPSSRPACTARHRSRSPRPPR